MNKCYPECLSSHESEETIACISHYNALSDFVPIIIPIYTYVLVYHEYNILRRSGVVVCKHWRVDSIPARDGIVDIYYICTNIFFQYGSLRVSLFGENVKISVSVMQWSIKVEHYNGFSFICKLLQLVYLYYKPNLFLC